MRYKCIIFDCDGVLVDSEPISIGILVEMAYSLQVDIHYTLAFNEFAGKSLQYCFDYIARESGRKLPETFENEFRDRTFTAFKKELKVIPGVHELLEHIQIPYCVASSGPPEKIRLNLSVTNLLEKFDGRIFSSYEIKSWKPDPGIFLHAAEKMGYAPSECVVIEDSISGVMAAKNGGFDVYGFAHSSGNEKLLKNEGAVVFSDMNELKTLLL